MFDLAYFYLSSTKIREECISFIHLASIDWLKNRRKKKPPVITLEAQIIRRNG